MLFKAPESARPGLSSDDKKNKTLFVYCAAGLKRPIAEAAAAYTKETGIEVQLFMEGLVLAF